MNEFFSTEEILKDFQQGKFVILIDDEDRENEGDLIIAAEFVKPEHVNFMAVHGRGLICLAMTSQQINQLKLPMMISREHSLARMETAFTYSIEASSGVTTGISAADRSHTIFTAIQKNAQPADVVCPGHVFPLKANDNGVLGRMGHTEAAVDLAKLSHLNPAAVICEIINLDGTMSRVKDLIPFARQHQIKMGTIQNLIEYRKKHSL